MKFILILLFTITANIKVVYSQTLFSEELRFGDTVPEVTIHNILHYQSDSIRLSDFRGKLVILDFFDTWCSSCIAALPKLDSLQRRFKNNIQIFVVDYEPAEKVLSFLKNNPVGKSITLPFITSDSILSKFFPHRLVPHEVWIDHDGIFKAATSAGQVNMSNINKLLSGKDVQFRMKEDIMNLTMQDLFFFNKNINMNKNNLKYYSAVSKKILGVGGGGFIKRDSNNMITRICYTNTSIMSLYKYALAVPWSGNRCVLEVKNPGDIEFVGGDYSEWIDQNTYCYELYSPPVTMEKAHQEMLHSLKNSFGYYARVEKRKIKCLVLKAKKAANKFISTGGEPEHNFVDSHRHIDPKYIHNQSISKLTDYLNYTLSIPVANETKFNKPVDIKLPDDLSNIDSLKSALHRYGFELKEAYRKMDVLVISDKKD